MGGMDPRLGRVGRDNTWKARRNESLAGTSRKGSAEGAEVGEVA